MLELKDVLAELDIHPEDLSKLTIEEFRKLRDEKFIGRAVVAEDPEIVKAITGKALGSINTAINGAFKDLGVELSNEDTKGKKVEEIIRFAVGKAKDALEEIKKKGSDGNDKKLNDALKQLEDEKKKRGETEELLKNSQALIEQQKKEFDGNVKAFKLNHKLAEEKAKIPLSETADDFKKRGFDVVFNETYKVDIDENEQLIVTDKLGNRVQNPTKTGFLGFAEVYKSELDKAGMIKKNNVVEKTGGAKPVVVPPAGGGQEKTFSLPPGMENHVNTLNGK